MAFACPTHTHTTYIALLAASQLQAGVSTLSLSLPPTPCVSLQLYLYLMTTAGCLLLLRARLQLKCTANCFFVCVCVSGKLKAESLWNHLSCSCSTDILLLVCIERERERVCGFSSIVLSKFADQKFSNGKQTTRHFEMPQTTWNWLWNSLQSQFKVSFSCYRQLLLLPLLPLSRLWFATLSCKLTVKLCGKNRGQHSWQQRARFWVSTAQL